MEVACPTNLSTLNKDKYKSIFYQKDRFSDSSTVAFSIVVIDRDREEFPTISSSKGHAEIAFIKDVTKFLSKIKKPVVNIEITINISKSPCFRCSADLENFFEYLRVTKGATRISFTLRIANLYCRDIDGGVKTDVINDLAFWLYHLQRDKTVDVVDIQPISVTQELKDYRDRKIDSVNWSDIFEKREKKDKGILTTVSEIKKGIVKEPMNTRKLFLKLTEVKELTAEGKRHFYVSQVTKAVAVAQVQINAENELGKASKEKIFRPIAKTTADSDMQHGDLPQGEYQRGCCATIPNIKVLLDEKIIKPKSWSIQSSTIALAVTHFPCDDCLAKITSDLHELKPRLILRVANIPNEDEAIVDWLFKLDQKGLKVELQAINVTDIRTNCKQNASQEEKDQWTDAKEERKELDVVAKENVDWINEQLTRRRLLQQDEAFSNLKICPISSTSLV